MDTVNMNTAAELDRILTVQHLGVDEKDIIDEINPTPPNIIVFNHRPDTYKHFKEFIAMCDKLWETRQDFKVWIPLLEKPNREYVTTTKGNKEWYYKNLQKVLVGFSPKQTYGGWSVSTTDGMMNGVPYIMYDDTYYHELNAEGDFFTDDNTALQLLNKYLDDREYRNKQANQALSWIKKRLIYKDKMEEMSDYMDLMISTTHQMGDSEKFNDILGWIKTAGRISKEELIDKLGWGRGIKWTPYRRALMAHPNVYDVNNTTPYYCWKTLDN